MFTIIDCGSIYDNFSQEKSTMIFDFTSFNFFKKGIGQSVSR